MSSANSSDPPEQDDHGEPRDAPNNRSNIHYWIVVTWIFCQWIAAIVNGWRQLALAFPPGQWNILGLEPVILANFPRKIFELAAIYFFFFLLIYAICIWINAYRGRQRNVLGLDPAVFASLPRFVCQSQNVRDGLNCIICLEDCAEDDACLRLPKCGHIFHEVCIRPWFEDHNDCPICRTEVAPNPQDLEAQRVQQGLEAEQEQQVLEAQRVQQGLEAEQEQQVLEAQRVQQGLEAEQEQQVLEFEDEQQVFESAGTEQVSESEPFPSDHSAESDNENNGQ